MSILYILLYIGLMCVASLTGCLLGHILAIFFYVQSKEYFRRIKIIMSELFNIALTCVSCLMGCFLGFIIAVLTE